MRAFVVRGCLPALVVNAVMLGLTITTTAWLVNPRTPSNTDISSSQVLIDPPAALDEPLVLKLVTFNIQSLWIVGQNRPARMRALGVLMRELDPDIVCWQEAFIDSDRETLLEHLAGSRLAYHEYFPSGTVGSGLMISSAYPIRETLFHRYAASNPWYRVWEGDWWAGKGVALARVELPGGLGLVDVYNTHAQAGYGNPAYIPVRLAQMEELAQFMESTMVPGHPAFLLGDMNAADGRNAGYEFVVDRANLERVLTVYSSIDHIFGVAQRGFGFEVEESWELDRFAGLRLSDHNGYASRVRIRPVPSR